MLNNVLYADLTGVFLVVGCTLFISLVNMVYYWLKQLDSKLSPVKGFMGWCYRFTYKIILTTTTVNNFIQSTAGKSTYDHFEDYP